MNIARAMALALASALVGTAAADSITIGASKDNTLFESTAGAVSNGAGAHFFAGDNAQSNTRRGVLAFDVAGNVPAGSVITNATLTLHMSKTVSGVVTMPLHRLLADWGEGTSDAPDPEGQGAPSTAGDATWLHTFYSGSFWASPGGDYSAVLTAATPVDGVGFYDWTSPTLIADVQDMLDNPGDDFGWVLLGDENTAQSVKRFDTRENPTTDFRPALTIEYVPEPGTLALLGVALLPMLRRNR